MHILALKMKIILFWQKKHSWHKLLMDWMIVVGVGLRITGSLGVFFFFLLCIVQAENFTFLQTKLRNLDLE